MPLTAIAALLIGQNTTVVKKPVLVVPVQAALPPQGGQMTLDQAVQLGLQNGFAIRIAKTRIDKAKQQEHAVNAQLYPKIDVSGTYSQQDTELSIPSSASSGSSGSSFFGPTGWQTYRSVTATLTQGVDIAGLAPRELDVYRYQRKAEEENAKTETIALVNQIRQKYFNLLQDIDLLHVQQERLAAAIERVNKAQVKLDAGAVPKFEVIRLQDDEKKSEQDVLVATSNIVLTRQDLNNTIGIPIELEYTPVAVDANPDIALTPDQLVGNAMVNRPEIRQGRDVYLSAKNATVVATNTQKPSLNLTATSTKYFDPPDFATSTFNQVQAKLSMNIWDSGVTKFNVAAARADEDQAEIQMERVELSVALDVRTTLTNLKTASDARDLAAKNVELACESLRLAQLRYDNQVGILLDVITAQSDLTAAEQSQVAANYQFMQAYAALQHAVGADDLQAHDPDPNAKKVKGKTTPLKSK